MDKELKKDINQYIKEIKLNIICDFKTRKKFISDLKNSIYDFVEDENIFSIDDVFCFTEAFQFHEVPFINC